MERLPPTILVIFGITGDLSHRFLLPALAEIVTAGQISVDFKILGVSRQSVNVEDVFKEAQEPLKNHAEILQMDYDSKAAYESLKSKLEEVAAQDSQIIFYFALPPDAVPAVVKNLGESGLNTPNTKLLLEKPFGVDLESARKLIEETAKYYPEDQVYRIDHYLAKEMAQNITVFLGSNSIFRGVWSNAFIDEIEVLAAEKIGIEGRGHFYEGTGALRDFIQSHLLQLAALVLMEPCSDIFDFAEIPQRRLAALKAIKPIPADEINRRAFRAQYEGYKEEVKNPESTVETFASLTLESSDPRWEGVPIRLITGKNLDQKLTQIKVRFKKVADAQTNSLMIKIAPKEGIELDLWVKEPGYERKLQKLPLSFAYEQHFGRLPDAYEQVLIDAMRGNHSLFASSTEVLASWEIIDPVLKYWQTNKDVPLYKPGSTIEEVLSIKK